MKNIMNKKLMEISNRKVSYEIGILKNQYLKNIENKIQQSLTTQTLSNYYNLINSGHHTRYVCPIHPNASNPTSFCMDDSQKSFICYSCNEHGTYIELIGLLEGCKFHDALIYAANNFTALNLGFTSISDFEKQVRDLVMKQYKKTSSLNYLDYYPTTLLDHVKTNRVDEHIDSRTSKVTEIKHSSKIKTTMITSNKVININPNRKFSLDQLDLEKEYKKSLTEKLIKDGKFDFEMESRTALDSHLISDLNRRFS